MAGLTGLVINVGPQLFSQLLHDLFVIILKRVAHRQPREIGNVVVEMGMGAVERSLNDASVGIHRGLKGSRFLEFLGLRNFK